MTRCTDGLPEAGGTDEALEIIERPRRCLFVVCLQSATTSSVCQGCESKAISREAFDYIVDITLEGPWLCCQLEAS
jgi:hypothetical protein